MGLIEGSVVRVRFKKHRTTKNEARFFLHWGGGMILCWVGDLLNWRGIIFCWGEILCIVREIIFCGGRILLHWGGNYFCWGEILCIGRGISFCGGRILLHWGGNHFCWGEIFLHWVENIVFECFWGCLLCFFHWGSNCLLLGVIFTLRVEKSRLKESEIIMHSFSIAVYQYLQ